jgi:dipeptidyl-peptidase-3
VSPESEPIYDFIIGLYHACNGNWKELQRHSGVTDDELRWFLEYAAQFLGNCGNYKSFGDSKFIPRARPEVFEAVAATSAETKHLFERTKVGGGLYATKDPALMHFGYPGHMSTYYPDSPGITKEEITHVGEFLDKKRLLPENTRLRKTEKGDFEVLIASGVKSPPADARDLGEETRWELDGPLKGKTVCLIFGDHVEEMAKIALNIKKAEQEAANEIQRKMHEEYAKSFGTWSMKAYKQSQRFWIQDKGPMVESDIGFVETYRDPHGVRGEWEGFGAYLVLLFEPTLMPPATRVLSLC